MKASENDPMGQGLEKMEFLCVVRMALKKTAITFHRVGML